MTLEQKNPLTKFFRQPAVYIKLPSEGKWWDDNCLELPVTGEVGIYAMTTRDEITLKTPDALLNGQGIVDVIQSCVPSIKDAWKMPSVDVDSLLIAIRIASYGEYMHFETVCPHCNFDNNYDIDLKSILTSITCPDYSKPVIYKSLKIKLHPQKYHTVNQSNRLNFEEQKINNALSMGDDIDPNVKLKMVTDGMNRLVELGITSLVESVEYIELEDGERISNKDYIKEFFNNSESSMIKSIQDRLLEYVEISRIKPTGVNCGNSECLKSYEVNIEFDYANFFV
jgi:hypothetical protein